MISKEAIAYDLREARERLAHRQTKEVRRHIDLTMENLKYLLVPQRNRLKKRDEQSQACPADDLGRENIEALRASCEQAAEAVATETPIARRESCRPPKASGTHCQTQSND